MCSIADEDDTTTMPSFEVQPLDRPAVDHVVASQSGQVALDDTSEPGEPVAEPMQPPLLGIMKALGGHVPKAISTPLIGQRPKKQPSPNQN
jgi:hypothetical protein